MADKQLSLRQHAEDGFFADDDPLAELARIASFDPQGETRPRPVHLRREPEFNLEDELLKEFEQFEEPARSVPPLDLSVPDVHAEQPVAVEEPVLAAVPAFADPVFEEEPAFEEEFTEAEGFVTEAVPVVEPAPASAPEPIKASPGLYAVPRPSFEAPIKPARPVAHPVFELEDEIFKEFAAFDAKRAERKPVVESLAANAMPIDTAAAEPVAAVEPEPELHVAPIAEMQPPVEPATDALQEPETQEVHAADSGYGDDDLAVEAEIEPEDAGLDMPALEAMEAEVDPVRWHESKEPIFADDEGLVPVAKEEAVDEPERFAALAGTERWNDEAAIEPPAEMEDAAEEPVFEEYGEAAALSPAVETVIQPVVIAQSEIAPTLEIEAPPTVASEPEPEVRPIPAAPVVADVQATPAGRDEYGLDALLADVERYPVAASLSRQPVPVAQPVTAVPVEKPIEQAAAVVEMEAPVAVAAASEPVAEPKAKQQDALAAAKPAQAHEPFDDGAFELDLTEIELDMLEMEVESIVAPAANSDHIVASASVLASVAKAAVEEKPTYVPERSFVPQPPQVEDYSSLPFDPSQVVSEEEPVEALADMDVPDAPVVDHDVVTVPAQPDYDIDIDAEMAHIFARPAETKPARAGGQQAKSDEAVAVAAATTSVDLDEFERALEEDFRRSLSENRATGTPDRVALTPSSYDNGGRQGSLGRRLTILAASVAGLVLIGGAAVYAYWGSPGRILSTSSEPKIILADKDPVKVQPKDPGGQVVPNQDKVVYDRVSGDDRDITKQDRLVTSNEEPVDVVQKTLMPENLPSDDDDQANATTDTTDTTDPRLLPDGQDKNITTTEKTVSGVSPRKVRTMVVRSDGTLVPRDDDADTAAADTAKKDTTPAEQSQERSLDITPAATEDVPERLAANDAIAKEIQAASTEDSKAFVPEAKQPSDAVEARQPADATDTQATDTQAADTAVTETQPVTDDQPAVKTEDKPVVADTADSSDNKIADIMPVKKEELAAPATETDNAATDNTAVAEKADTPVADDAKPAEQAAIKDAANADVEDTAPIRSVKTTKISANTPIPENRPVDQPVDIVGRVTDQGNVQKNQEVANADPVQQPADNSQATTPAAAYVIQIASLPSAAEAQNSYNKLSAKFASVIGGHGVDIRKASIKNKGTYYRVRIPVGTRQEAAELCARYKAAGGSCLVSR